MANGFIIIFSHILPLIIGFLSILLIINGIMDEQKHISIIGIISLNREGLTTDVLFLVASLGPFLILSFLL